MNPGVHEKDVIDADHRGPGAQPAPEPGVPAEQVRVRDAMDPAGWIYIRDIVLDSTRTAPLSGALFAVNMLSATQGGNSYTFDQLQSDLQSAGFVNVEQIRHDEGMHSVVRAQSGQTP